MSLHIGNLSHRTRRDDLERVFSRFGRCEVRIKDAYGFVVYDFPPNAEKALTALRGRAICGEQLTISWSKKQPQHPARLSRGDRPYEPLRRGNSARRGDYSWRDYKMNVKQPDSYHQDNANNYTREEHHHFRENLPSEGGDAEPTPLDNGRWGDQVRDISNDYGFENEAEFERYEPHQGYERREEYEIRQIGGCSSGNHQEKIERDLTGEVNLGPLNDLKVKGRCYNCGAKGHKQRNCPRRNASQRKFIRFDNRQNNKISKEGRGGFQRYGSKSWGELQSSKDTSMAEDKNDKEVSDSRNHEMPLKIGGSPRRKETDSVQREDYGGKKRSGSEIGTSKGRSSKRARKPVSSLLHSDYTASRSHSISQLSKSQRRSTRSRSRSRSISISSRAHSLSSNSRSKSPTSLSASVGQLLPSPQNEVQLNLEGMVDNATTESRKVSVEQGQLGEGDLETYNAKLDDTMGLVYGEKALRSFSKENDTGSDQPLQRTSGLSNMTNPGTPLSDKGVLTNGSLSSASLDETRGHLFSSALVEDPPLPTPFKKPDARAPFSSHSCNSTSISSEELHKVLKLYGLALPGDNERHLSVEDYFGSSRLWPWEIVYYRRLKKGPITNENYARRLDQNREFGIVDKYIRSSSGWEESSQDS